MKLPRFIAGILGIVAVALLAMAAYGTFQRYKAVLLWKPVEATVVENGIGFNHDGEGRLRFYARAALQYSTPDGEQKTIADSDFKSIDYADVRSRLDNLSLGRKIKVYYDPARHPDVRFGTEYSFDYLGRATYYYAGATLAAFAALVIPVLRKPDSICSGCKTKLRHDYRYCTLCGAPAATSSNLIRNDRPVET